MYYDKLRDRAALIILQHLLEKNKSEKFVDSQGLSSEAWQYADDFLNERGSSCSRCLNNIDGKKLIKAAKAAGAVTEEGAGPKKKK